MLYAPSKLITAQYIQAMILCTGQVEYMGAAECKQHQAMISMMHTISSDRNVPLQLDVAKAWKGTVCCIQDILADWHNFDSDDLLPSRDGACWCVSKAGQSNLI